MSIVRLGSSEVYRNPWISVREDAIMRADGLTGVYGVVDKPAYSLIIPQSDDGRLYLVEQYRYPVQARRWEFPAGSAPQPSNLSPVDVARAELREETGFRARRLTPLGVLDVSPGTSSQQGFVFLATELVRGEPEREPEEGDMEARWWTRDEFERAMRDGTIRDAQTLAAYTLLTVAAVDRCGRGTR
ncbi:NUDIX hydrolase [Rhodococcus erythropolis]|uniref:NUDIX hydrolase n=1 Tax=Rhodococcus erythropolis TaxID=1833 RepID=UPI002949F931|nr:NUDIX hydrolase [Rhodococcus erythropolis]MDV6278024.1 NUDIX hydrolase [Rhodococcus erythropolis]